MRSYEKLLGRKNTSIKKLTVKKNNCVTIIKTTQSGLKKKTIGIKLKLESVENNEHLTDKNCLLLVFPFKEEQATICKRPFFILENTIQNGIFVPTNILLSIMFNLGRYTMANFALTCKKMACLYRSNIVQKSHDCFSMLSLSFDDDDSIENSNFSNNLTENYGSDLYENRVKHTLNKHYCPICKKFYQEVHPHVKNFHKNDYDNYCSNCNKINGNNCFYCTICDVCGNRCNNCECCSCGGGGCESCIANWN